MGKRTGRPNGRPPRWNEPGLREALIENTRTLGLRHLAAQLAGLSERVLYEWLAEGEKPNAQADYAQFAQKMKVARAEYIARKWARIEKAAEDPRHWTADMTQLERMDPEHFGRRERVELTGKDGGALEIEIKWDSAQP